MFYNYLLDTLKSVLQTVLPFDSLRVHVVNGRHSNLTCSTDSPYYYERRLITVTLCNYSFTPILGVCRNYSENVTRQQGQKIFSPSISSTVYEFT